MLKMGSTQDKREQHRLMRDAMEKRFTRVTRGSFIGGMRLGMFTASYCVLHSPLTMAAKLVSSSASILVPSFLSPFQPQTSFQFRPSRHQPAHIHCYRSLHLKTDKIDSLLVSFRDQKPKNVFKKGAYLSLATSEEQSQYTDQTPDDPETVSHQIVPEDTPPDDSSSIQYSGNGGKPGFISFYNPPRNKTEDIVAPPEAQSTWGRLLWLIGPAVLVSSFILPPIYLRRIVSAVFEDSLLTDFLILFFTEALFYCGVAAFLLIVHRSRKSSGKVPDNRTNPSQLGQRISSVATLVLSLMIPMVTMGFVWPWTGPAASATLAPYLVGIVVQFAFEQYARYRKSPSSPVIPIIFQVYRLHQLNRAAQLVTALSFTVKGAEATYINLAIKKSLGTLLNVIQVLGVISIWSISSFLTWLSSSPSQNQS